MERHLRTPRIDAVDGTEGDKEDNVKTPRLMLVIFVSLLTAAGWAQTEPPARGDVPIYRITVVARSIKAINYQHRSGSTKVDFRGTSLLPDARGTAEVQSKQGAIHVDAEFKHLRPASMFGPEYLTYVLWAISPEGRPVNLGEVLPNDDGNSKLDVSSSLQSFGLIVTAEPYFAVTQPSDVVVMENFVTRHTNGTIEEVDAKYELLQRGQYTLNVSPSDLHPIVLAPNVPLELDEARNAVRIAGWAGAKQYASGSFDKARLDLKNAEDFQASRGSRKTVITEAREAAQMAEDARVIAVKKQEQEFQAQQQQDAADTAAAAKSQARQAQAEAQQATEEKAQAEAATEAAQTQEQQAKAETADARAAADQAQQQAQQAEQEKAAMRAKLLQQLNTILQTRDTQRGLIVNMSDILFETGQYKLKQGAREALAKVAGVLLAYPGLNVEIDGYTDNVGSEQTNETLSEKRAESVRDFLVQQGVPASSVAAHGFGEANPVAVNDTVVGRQLNRRVELVLSGEVIGAAVSTPAAPGSGR